MTREHTQETTEGEGVEGNNEDRGRYGVEKWEKEEVQCHIGDRNERPNAFSGGSHNSILFF